MFKILRQLWRNCKSVGNSECTVKKSSQIFCELNVSPYIMLLHDAKSHRSGEKNFQNENVSFCCCLFIPWTYFSHRNSTYFSLSAECGMSESKFRSSCDLLSTDGSVKPRIRSNFKLHLCCCRSQRGQQETNNNNNNDYTHGSKKEAKSIQRPISIKSSEVNKLSRRKEKKKWTCSVGLRATKRWYQKVNMNNLETLQCRIEQAFPLSSIYSTTALTIICVSMTTRNTAFPLNAKTHWDKKEQKQRRRNTFTPFHQKHKSSLEWTKKKITKKTKKKVAKTTRISMTDAN